MTLVGINRCWKRHPRTRGVSTPLLGGCGPAATDVSAGPQRAEKPRWCPGGGTGLCCVRAGKEKSPAALPRGSWRSGRCETRLELEVDAQPDGIDRRVNARVGRDVVGLGAEIEVLVLKLGRDVLGQAHFHAGAESVAIV